MKSVITLSTVSGQQVITTINYVQKIPIPFPTEGIETNGDHVLTLNSKWDGFVNLICYPNGQPLSAQLLKLLVGRPWFTSES